MTWLLSLQVRPNTWSTDMTTLHLTWWSNIEACCPVVSNDADCLQKPNRKHRLLALTWNKRWCYNLSKICSTNTDTSHAVYIRVMHVPVMHVKYRTRWTFNVLTQTSQHILSVEWEVCANSINTCSRSQSVMMKQNSTFSALPDTSFLTTLQTRTNCSNCSWKRVCSYNICGFMRQNFTHSMPTAGTHWNTYNNSEKTRVTVCRCQNVMYWVGEIVCSTL